MKWKIFFWNLFNVPYFRITVDCHRQLAHVFLIRRSRVMSLHKVIKASGGIIAVPSYIHNKLTSIRYVNTTSPNQITTCRPYRLDGGNFHQADQSIYT